MAGKLTATLPDLGWLYRPTFPGSWRRSKLYPLARWTNGMAFRNINFSPAGRPVIKIAEIKNGISGQTQFTDADYDSVYLMREGDMLFSWSGQPESSIDAFWWRGPEGWLNQHVFKVDPDLSQCRSDFFFYLLKYLKPHFIGIARNKQTTGLGHVTRKDLEEIEVGVPDKALQRAIAHILGTLDDKIELNRRMNETLEAIARALFKSWFVDLDPVRAKAEGRDLGLPKHIADLFPDSFEDSELGEIPKGWEVVPLPEVIEINPVRRLRKGDIAPYLDMANMPTRGHSPDAVTERAFGSGMRFISGDTLVARITPCLENGKTAYVDFLKDDQVGWGSTEYVVLRPKPPLPTEYAYCLARSNEFRDFAIQSMTGSSGRQRVPPEALSHFLVVSPPKEIAELFGQLIMPLFSRVYAATRESRTLAALRDTLLPKLISGVLRVKDVERLTGVIIT